MKIAFGFLLLLLFLLSSVHLLADISSEDQEIIHQLEKLKVQLIALKQKSETLNQTLKLQSEESKNLKNYNQQIEKQLIDLLNQIELLKNSLNNKETSLTSLKSEVQQLKQKVAKLEQELEMLSIQLTELLNTLRIEKIKIGAISFSVGLAVGAVAVILIRR